jgi:hypothetical protein
MVQHDTAAGISRLIAPPGERIPADPLTAPAEGYLLDYRRYDFGEYPHVIPELLPVGACLLWARPGIGKSMLSLQAEMSIACGRMFAGWRPEEPAPVLVIDYEAGFTQTLSMTHRVAEYMMLPADEDTEEGARLRTLMTYRSEVPGQSFNERVITLQSWLEEARAAGAPFRVVRIDTLAMFMGPAPQGYNAYEWASMAVGALNRLAVDYHCSIIIIHHPNKMGEVSGSTGIEGKATISWKVEREPSESEALLRCSKNRVGPEKSWKLYFDLERGLWEFEAAVTQAQASCTGTRRRVLDLLAEHGPLTGRELRTLMPDVKPETGKRAMSRLKDKGWILRSDEGVWMLASPASTPTRTPVISQSQEVMEVTPDPDAGDLDRCQVCGELITGADGHPDCVPAPEGTKRWDSFGAMRRCLEGSRMKPLWFVPVSERNSGAWPAAILADLSAEAGYKWQAEGLEANGPHLTVMPFDRSQSFTSACSSVPVAANQLTHTGVWAYDPRDKEHSEHGLAGIAQVIAPHPVPGMPHPLGRRAVPGDPIWIPSGRLELLWKLHEAGLLDRPQVIDSWMGRRTVGLFDPYAEAVREARDTWKDDPEMTAAVKRSASTALRCLYPIAAKSPWWRPDWRAAVVAEAGDRLWCVAHRAVQQGAELVHMGNVDQVAYLLPQGHGAEWYPPGYKAGRDPGTYHWGSTRVRVGTDMTGVDMGRVEQSPADQRVLVISGPVPLRTWLARRG